MIQVHLAEHTMPGAACACRGQPFTSRTPLPKPMERVLHPPVPYPTHHQLLQQLSILLDLSKLLHLGPTCGRQPEAGPQLPGERACHLPQSLLRQVQPSQLQQGLLWRTQGDAREHLSRWGGGEWGGGVREGMGREREGGREGGGPAVAHSGRRPRTSGECKRGGAGRE